jgi:hypothetical protein
MTFGFFTQHTVETLFKIFLLLTLIISFYMFILTFITKQPKYFKTFSSWQFPMLLALLIDVYIIEC